MRRDLNLYSRLNFFSKAGCRGWEGGAPKIIARLLELSGASFDAA